MRRARFMLVPLLAALTLSVPAVAVGAVQGDALVSVGSPSGPFAMNKQNEPAVAIDARHPNVLIAGSNDEIDMEACNAGTDNTCPFTDGVGSSGVYFSYDGGGSWTQPTYQGLTARGCTGLPGDSDPACVATTGPIGTVPGYAEQGLVSDGDAAVAIGPVYANGAFSWANGSRYYYANLTSKTLGSNAFKGFEAIAVSRIDGPASTGLTPAIASNGSNWKAPVIASKQNAAFFADKEQLWADNASSSPFFGNAYVCYAGFRSAAAHGFPGQPLFVLRSTNGGRSWSQKQVTAAANNPAGAQGFGRSGCTVRTDSNGDVYVFYYRFAVGTPGKGAIMVTTSHDGGARWTRPRSVTPAYDQCFFVEASIGRCVSDGIGGARNDLGPSPSIDIANGAPTGRDATDQIVLSWVDGRAGLNHEQVLFTSSTDRGATWAALRQVQQPGDRGYYSAPAISPDGSDAYLVYNAFTTPFRDNTTQARGLVGVVLHADISGFGNVGAFASLHRGEVGDPRGSSQNNLAAEFLGDYVYAAATRTYGTAVWNDTRNAGVCAAVNAYRQALHDASVAQGVSLSEGEEPRGVEDFMEKHGGKAVASAGVPTAPAIQAVCPRTFGNSDIYGGSFLDPTP